MYQLARAIFKNPTDTTKVTLIFGNITESDILLKQRIPRPRKHLPATLPRFLPPRQAPRRLDAGERVYHERITEDGAAGAEGGEFEDFRGVGRRGCIRLLVGRRRARVIRGSWRDI